MKNKLIILLGIITLYGCNNDPEVLGQMALDSVAPGSVTITSVVNGPGNATITYSLPSDSDLLYVEATYKVNDNLTRKAEASFYNNELFLEGFGEAKAYTVSVVAVDASKNRSAPVEVIVNPENGPVITAFETLNVVAAFGGINLSWLNESNSNLEIEVYINDLDNVGFFKEQTVIYSSDSEGDFNVRGLDPEPRTFRVTIVDRWGNRSETLEIVLTPIIEIELDKSLWDVAVNWDIHPAGPLERLNDGIKGTNANRALAMPVNPARPRIDIDLGAEAKLSRFLMDPWPNGDVAMFNNNNQRYFKLYGSNNPSAYDAADYSAWVIIEENGEIVKPSGLPRGQLTAADRLAFNAGFVTDIKINVPSYRYFRYEVIEDWSGTNRFMAAEFTLFGNYVN